nr:hypothetical protein [Caballeronia sp. GAOx1]
MNLDVDQHHMRKVAPEMCRKLTRRRKEKQTQKTHESFELGFREFYQSFSDLQRQGIYPSDRKVRNDVLQRTGTRLTGWKSSKYLERAHQLSGSQRRHRNGSIRVNLQKQGVS